MGNQAGIFPPKRGKQKFVNGAIKGKRFVSGGEKKFFF